VRIGEWLLGSCCMVLSMPGQDAAQVLPDLGDDGQRGAYVRAVAEEVVAMRGLAAPPEILHLLATTERLQQDLQRTFDEGPDAAFLRGKELWLRALDLLEEGSTLRGALLALLQSHVVAYYETDGQRLYLLEGACAFGPQVLRSVTAHELIHAIDDQQYSLGARFAAARQCEEPHRVLRALVEGNAHLWMGRLPPGQAQVVDEEQAGRMRAAMRQQQQGQMDLLRKAPSYVCLATASYHLGRAFLQACGDPERDTFALAMADPPRSTEQILHPEKYWDAQARDEPVVLARESVFAERLQEILAGRVVHRDTLGELVTALVCGPAHRRIHPMLMQSSSYWTNRAAAGWGGDRLFVVEREGEPRHAVVWITVWDTEEDRQQFERAVRRHRQTVLAAPGIEVRGRLAVAFFGSVDSAQQAAVTALLQETEFEQAGQPFHP
jgi:hypothetical protein